MFAKLMFTWERNFLMAVLLSLSLNVCLADDRGEGRNSIESGSGVSFPQGMSEAEKERLLKSLQLDVNSTDHVLENSVDHLPKCPQEIRKALILIESDKTRKQGVNLLVEQANQGNHLSATKLAQYYEKRLPAESLKAQQWREKAESLRNQEQVKGKISGVVTGPESFKDCAYP